MIEQRDLMVQVTRHALRHSLGDAAAQSPISRILTEAQHWQGSARWQLPQTHPEFASEGMCAAIVTRLCGELLSLKGAPGLGSRQFRACLTYTLILHLIEPGAFEELLLGRFGLPTLVELAAGPDCLRIARLDPTAPWKSANVSWRLPASLSLQGALPPGEAVNLCRQVLATQYERYAAMTEAFADKLPVELKTGRPLGLERLRMLADEMRHGAENMTFTQPLCESLKPGAEDALK